MKKNLRAKAAVSILGVLGASLLATTDAGAWCQDNGCGNDSWAETIGSGSTYCSATCSSGSYFSYMHQTNYAETSYNPMFSLGIANDYGFNGNVNYGFQMGAVIYCNDQANYYGSGDSSVYYSATYGNGGHNDAYVYCPSGNSSYFWSYVIMRSS
jgi:hypothetical protein